MNYSLENIAKIIDASLDGEASKVIHGVNTLENAQINQISYATSKKYLDPLRKTLAGAVILENLSLIHI